MIERLAQGGRDKLKEDGLNLSDWLQSLASFWGHLYVSIFLVSSPKHPPSFFSCKSHMFSIQCCMYVNFYYFRRWLRGLYLNLKFLAGLSHLRMCMFICCTFVSFDSLLSVLISSDVWSSIL